MSAPPILHRPVALVRFVDIHNGLIEEHGILEINIAQQEIPVLMALQGGVEPAKDERLLYGIGADRYVVGDQLQVIVHMGKCYMTGFMWENIIEMPEDEGRIAVERRYQRLNTLFSEKIIIIKKTEILGFCQSDAKIASVYYSEFLELNQGMAAVANG